MRRGAAELCGRVPGEGLTLDEVEGPRFQRIAQIRELRGEGLLGEDLRFRVPA